MCNDENVTHIYGHLIFMFQVIELVPNGGKIKVRNPTKSQYLDGLAQYRLASRVRDEVEAFLRGLNDLIPDNLLSIFDENELEVCLSIFIYHNIIDVLKIANFRFFFISLLHYYI